MDKVPKDAKGFFQGAMASLNPYVQAGKFKPFDGDTDLTEGVRAIASHGHTPGHVKYLVQSKGQKLMLWGDLIHVAAVQFDQPTVTIQFDTNAKAAMAQRLKAFAEAAKEGHMVAATHLSFPGMGHLLAQGKGYRFVPLNYVALP
jgi:glyoxylase-like metal-dependent hydrolase (beta-lactamase superfamily II)